MTLDITAQDLLDGTAAYPTAEAELAALNAGTHPFLADDDLMDAVYRWASFCDHCEVWMARDDITSSDEWAYYTELCDGCLETAAS